MPNENKPLDLDLTGYRCPVPVVKLEAAMRQQPDITTFRVATDDPVAVIDIPHFCRENGVEAEILTGESTQSLRKAGHNDDFCVFLVTRATKPREIKG